MTADLLQAVPQVLLHPWGQAPLSRAEADTLHAALTPRHRSDLEQDGHSGRVLDAMLQRGLLAPAPAKSGTWHRYGWGRPQALVRAAAHARAAMAPDTPASPSTAAGVVDSRAVFDRVLARRSVRQFARQPMPAPVLHDVLDAAGRVLPAWPHLRLLVAVQDVTDLARGVHRYTPGATGPLDLARKGLDDRQLRDCAHQYWVLGTGATVFVTVNWTLLEQSHGRGPDAYTQLLLECGRVAHTLVLAAARLGAGTWMTPAIDEKTAAAVLGLDPAVEEALYLVKVGMPREDS
jgi:nitroreductase